MLHEQRLVAGVEVLDHYDFGVIAVVAAVVLVRVVQAVTHVDSMAMVMMMAVTVGIGCYLVDEMVVK